MQQWNAGQPQGQQSQSVHGEEGIPQEPGHWFNRLKGARGQGESPTGHTHEPGAPPGFSRSTQFQTPPNMTP
eukprot:12926372-Prorocentrum_lima.AAC.1